MRSDDRGAVAVLVAILMTVLLGFGALVLDVGQIYAERRQLQNGADAAVLSLALDCPTASGCSTDLSVGGPAGTKVNQNDADPANNEAQVTEICGATVPAQSSLLSCSTPPSPGAWPWDCRPVAPALSTNYVQVRTQTRRNASNLVPPLLSRLLNPGYAGTNVRACARASWGGPSGLATGISVTISSCEWNQATSNGTDFAPPPPYPPNPATSYERVLKLHTTTTSTCPGGGASGSDRPGAFGWLNDDPIADCSADVNMSTSTVGTDPGNNISQACRDAFDLATTSPYPIMYIPVYNSAVASGNNTTYAIRGFAAFVVTGANLPGYNKPSWLYPSNPAACSGNEKCIYGFFTQALVPTAGTIGGPSMGVTVIQMSG